MSGDFSPEQKRYLEGFTSGPADRARRARARRRQARRASADRARRRASSRRRTAPSRPAASSTTRRSSSASSIRSTPTAASRSRPRPTSSPKPADNFRWRYYGLFYVAPAQNSYMCRLRIPNGILKHWQFVGRRRSRRALRRRLLACHDARQSADPRDRAEERGRAARRRSQDLGLCSRGSGADNIRNVTGTPTAGIDPQELIDTRPYAREWHFHILNDRALYGLPRKFNVAFDGGGIIPVLEDTNDIGFQAVEVIDGFGVEPGVWFRLALGGITGHKDFARDTGVIVKPADATKVADAIVRVFIEHGDRTNRNKARLKYVLDAWGFEKFLALVEEKLGWKLVRVTGAKRSRRGPCSTAPRISACTRRSSRACTGSASCCRSAS